MPRVLSCLLLSLFVILPESFARAQSLKVGMTSKTLFCLPFYAAQKRALYAAEGLKVELILIGRSDVQLQALIAGEINFGTLNADGVILVNEKGANLRVIAGVDNAAPYILVGGKAFKKIEDLKGARLGVSGLRGGATSILTDYLKTKGLHYPRDYTFTVISGGTAARLTALESGAIAAGILGIPYSDIAIDQGFNKLGDTMEVISTYQFNGIRPGRRRTAPPSSSS
jgi:ABC-type nitrate/sulfonate/bicarbonate transport system substrate-binding protein